MQEGNLLVTCVQEGDLLVSCAQKGDLLMLNGYQGDLLTASRLGETCSCGLLDSYETTSSYVSTQPSKHGPVGEVVCKAIEAFHVLQCT